MCGPSLEYMSRYTSYKRGTAAGRGFVPSAQEAGGEGRYRQDGLLAANGRRVILRVHKEVI